MSLKNLMKKYKLIIIPALAALLAVIVFKCVLFIGVVPSSSMEPTIQHGSHIVGSRLYGELENGDIIVFEHDGRLLVKRIGGIPGDTVTPVIGTKVVPEDCYYVLGDNTDNSYDSRHWLNPFIEESDIVAVVILY